MAAQRLGSVLLLALALCLAPSRALSSQALSLRRAVPLEALPPHRGAAGNRTAAQKSRPGELFRQEMENTEDLQYHAAIKVGAQELKGVLDTGSFELLVFSDRCTTCGPEEKYDRTKSKTARQGEAITKHSFGSGDTLSIEAWETVSLGPLVAKDQPFWEVFEAEMPVLQSGNLAAIVGVGPPNTVRKQAEEQVEAVENEWDTARAMGIPEDEIDRAKKELEEEAQRAAMKSTLVETLGLTDFSVCLLRRSGGPGYFVWNDKAYSDPELDGVFQRLPVEASYNWGVSMRGTGLRYRPGHSGETQQLRTLGCENGCAALFDSGTSLISAPSAVVQQVTALLEENDGACNRLDKMPDLVFTLGGREYTLPPDAYIGEVVEDMVVTRKWPGPLGRILPPIPVGKVPQPVCKALLMPLDQETQFGSMWILGMPFFRHYYTTFSRLPQGPPYNQTLYIAPASEDCKPTRKNRLALCASSTEGDSAARGCAVSRARTVRMSKVRLPKWLRKAKGSYHHL